MPTFLGEKDSLLARLIAGEFQSHGGLLGFDDHPRARTKERLHLFLRHRRDQGSEYPRIPESECQSGTRRCSEPNKVYEVRSHFVQSRLGCYVETPAAAPTVFHQNVQQLGLGR